MTAPSHPWIVLLGVNDRKTYADPEAFGPFGSEDECYSFAATASREPNDWLPLRIQDPQTMLTEED